MTSDWLVCHDQTSKSRCEQYCENFIVSRYIDRDSPDRRASRSVRRARAHRIARAAIDRAPPLKYSKHAQIKLVFSSYYFITFA